MKSFLTATGLAAALIACGSDPGWSVLKQTIRASYPDVRQISTDSLGLWMANDHVEQPVLLDARGVDEYEMSHLQGAFHIGNDTEALQLSPDLQKDAPLVVYCSVGYRSSKVAAYLMQEGYTNVANLEGSIFEWANSGRPVYQGDQLVTRVHPYDAVWGRFLNKKLHP